MYIYTYFYKCSTKNPIIFSDICPAIYFLGIFVRFQKFQGRNCVSLDSYLYIFVRICKHV